MKKIILLLAAISGSAAFCLAGVNIDDAAFAKSLGGWKKGNYANYSLSGADYRSYKPEVSPTPDGGIFVSVRIDHVRGWLSNNDHAGLEITVNSKGQIVSAQSTIAIQGQSIVSDVILGSNEAGKELFGAERAVQIGTDLVSNLTAKLLRENIVEAGRVSFPSALRHNYNRLFQSIRVDDAAIPSAVAVTDATAVKPPGAAPASVPAPPPEAPAAAPKTAGTEADKAKAPAPPIPEDPTAKPLQIKPFGMDPPDLPVKK